VDSPSPPVRWGILGTANVATKVGGAIRRARHAELVAIASRSQERAEEWASRHDVSRAYGAYDALLDDADVDVVYIPLPPSLHAEWTIRAAERRKHVLCEKPVALSAAEAREMADACRSNGVQLMDGVMWVHHERTEAMAEVIREGTLGALRRVTAAFTFCWERVPPQNIRLKKELGGGCLGDLGYYCVRACLWAFGEMPERVFATARYAHGVDFNVSALLWFSGERMASFDCAFDTAGRQWFEVAGTRACIVCDDYVVPSGTDVARFWIHGSGRNEERSVQNCVQEVRMVERFSEVVRTGRLEEGWVSDAVNTMRVCDAMLQSAERGRVVQM
jgi:predicted dehydrogenase